MTKDVSEQTANLFYDNIFHMIDFHTPISECNDNGNVYYKEALLVTDSDQIKIVFDTIRPTIFTRKDKKGNPESYSFDYMSTSNIKVRVNIDKKGYTIKTLNNTRKLIDTMAFITYIYLTFKHVAR